MDTKLEKDDEKENEEGGEQKKVCFCILFMNHIFLLRMHLGCY